MALKPPTITRLQGKPSLRMGAPPVPGKLVTTGKSVAVGGVSVAVVGGVTVGVSVGPDGVVVGVAVGPDGVVVGVYVDVAACVSVGVSVGCATQNTGVMVLSSSVTAPVRATALPAKLALLFMVMDAKAKIFPMNSVVVPRVAELPTFQNTLQTGIPLLI